LKELDLSEGRGTGIPKILRAMQLNGSAEPQFETDADRSYFVTRLPLRAAPTGQVDKDPTQEKGAIYDPSLLVAGQVTGQVAGQVLRFCTKARKAADIQEHVGIKHRETFVLNYLRPLVAAGWLALTLPDKPRSPNQRYATTDAGKVWLAAHPPTT
jgi:ATP-dependent DNA helicase RecG